jgi:thiosulfate/3-mercaptopyruvate sulfurtransferase
VTLVDVPTLARQLAEPDPPTLIDVRWKLGGPPGAEAYLSAHIPGAVFLDLDRDLTGPPGPGGRHPLPDPDALQDALRAAGVRAGHPVVAYDAGDGVPAARLWWTLRWAGHDAVTVLDGGLAAWLAAGLAVEAGVVTVIPGDVQVRPGAMPVLDAGGAAEVGRTGVLLDARTPVRYRGEQEPIDAVAGHIPGAVNLPAAQLVDDSGRLRPPGELRSAVEAAASGSPAVRSSAGGSDRAGAVGAYCGSGVTAAQTVLALEVAGYHRPALYVGSWSEWIVDPSRPIARGDSPADDLSGPAATGERL